MAMIPSYQDMLAQALQQQPQQQQSMGQSQQSKSIFNNPAFGNALTRMGVTMLANSGQGLSTGEAFGQGGLAFLDERQKQEELQREEQRQNAILARQQLQDNLQKMALQREAMQYDAAAQQAQNLPKEYQGLAVLDPLNTVKLAATNAFNQQAAEREFAQKVQLQNMQYGNQRALEEYKARQSGGMGDMPAAVKEWLVYQNMTPEQKEAYINMKRSSPSDMYENAYARSMGTEQGKLQLDAPTIELNSNYLLDTIQRLENSEGFDAIFGAPSLGKALQGGTGAGPSLPWGPAANAKNLRDQIENQSFLEMYDRLRGAGNIATVEGERGSQAFINLKSAQDPKQARESLKIIKDVIKKGQENLKKKLNTQPQFPMSQPQLPASSPQWSMPPALAPVNGGQ
jgi:hypothetical protein